MLSDMPLRRSLLFVPADQDAKVRKASTLSCDAVILDLEDGVRPSKKAEALDGALRALEELAFGGRERLIRMNALTSPWGRGELAAIARSRVMPDTVVIPKIDGPEAVIDVATALDATPIGLMPHIETAKGLLAAQAIAACHPKVNGLIFGAGDYLVQTGGQRTPQVLLFPRSAVVAAAAAAGLGAIDTPYFRLGDLAGLEADAKAAAELGFAGKAVIHPEQILVINRIFTPAPDRIAWAKRVLAMAEQTCAGAFIVDGEMADAMTLRIAQRVLAAKVTGVSDGP